MDRHYREFEVRLSGVSKEMDEKFLVDAITAAIAKSPIYPNGPEYDGDIEVELTEYSGELKTP